MSGREPSPYTTELAASPPPRRTSTLIPWLAALAFALVSLWLLAGSLALRSEVKLLETERELAHVSSDLAKAKLEERTLLAEKMISDLGARQQRPDAAAQLKVVILTLNRTLAPDATVAIAWDPQRKSGVLVAEKIPSTENDDAYELWAESGAGPAKRIGEFKVSKSNRTSYSFTSPDPVSGFILKQGAEPLGSAGL